MSGLKGDEIFMPRRGENIYKRIDGRYEGRYKCGKKENGKTQYKSVYAKTYTECKNRLIKAKSEIEQNKQTVKLTMTVKALCLNWLNDISISVKVSTINTYERIAEKHLLNKIGNIRVCDVSVEMLNNLIKEKLSSALSPRTVMNIVYVMKAIFKYAEKIYGTKNPAAFVIVPKVDKSEIDVLSKDEIRKLMDYCIKNETKYTFAVKFCLSTGLRIGELCAIRYSDIDLEKGVLTINKAVQRIKNIDHDISSKTKVIISSPKTATSKRELPLSKELIEAIKEYAYSNDIDGDMFLFSANKVKPIDVRSMQKNFAVILEKAGLRKVKFHILRHTFATAWVDAGFNIKALSELLGHSNITTTLSLYVHPSAETKREMINKLYAA